MVVSLIGHSRENNTLKPCSQISKLIFSIILFLTACNPDKTRPSVELVKDRVSKKLASFIIVAHDTNENLIKDSVFIRTIINRDTYQF